MFKKILSPNYNERAPKAYVKYLIYHYTACDLETSLRILTDHCSESPVSSHYLIDEKGEVYLLVNEDKRAWHAGKSFWAGQEDINSWSIGVELVNPGHGRDYRPFPIQQMEALAKLSRRIIEQYKINPWHILGHSDIAPSRKVDPGELFDWQWCSSNGIGIMPINTARKGEIKLSIAELQLRLKQYGYGIEITGVLDEQTFNVLRAFKMHFTPNEFTHEPTSATYQALLNLLAQKKSK